MKSHHHQHSPFHISVSPPSSGLRSARGDAGLEWAAPAGPGGCMTMCDDFDIYKTGCECAGAQEQQHALAEQDIARARQQSLILRLYVAQCPADVSSCVSSCVSSVMLVAGPSGYVLLSQSLRVSGRSATPDALATRNSPPRSDRRRRRHHHRRRECLGKAADHAAEAEVRDECLVFQSGARDGRGVLGAKPLRDGRALVGEPIRCGHGVGHDLSGDRADVVIRHLRASASASATAAASAAAPAVAAAFLAASRALDTTAARRSSRAATSCTCSAAASLAASPAASARSAADAAGLGAAAGGEVGAAAGGASLGSSPVAVARPALFFFLDFFERACPLACSAATSACGPSIAALAHAACTACIAWGATVAAGCGGSACCRVDSTVIVRPWSLACRAGRCVRRCRAVRWWPGPALRVLLKAIVAIAPSTIESTTQGQASGTRAHRATPRPSERHDVCCRMSSAVAMWPWSSACCRAVKPSSSSSSVLALASSRAFRHASCPRAAASIRAQNEHGGELTVARSSHERGDAVAAWQVDAPASLQQHPHHLQLAVGCGGVEDVGTKSGGALASVRWGGKRGGGRLWRRRCVLPDELRGGRVALVLGVLQGGVAIVVEQLGVGLGSQQSLHARLVPSASEESGRHQGTVASAGLQVRVGRVLQQDEQDGGVAVARSIHERGEAEVGWQVDARASLQQHPHHLQLAVARGGVQQGCGCGLAIFSWSRAERVDRPSLAQPVGHLLQLASPGRVVDLARQRGGRVHRGLTSVW
eukprot:scaffold44129_cov61-Phaeocystis_antarctica.AAC.5